MDLSLYRDLSWLPRPPADFNAQCSRLSSAGDECGQRIRALASCALDENQLIVLARALAKIRASGSPVPQLAPFRLGLLTNSTSDFMAPAMVATAARYGIALECITGGYDQALQESVSAESAVNRSQPDAVLIALDWRALPLKCSPGNAAAARNAIDAAVDQLNTIRRGIREHSRAVCLLQTLAPPPETVFGSLDRTVPGTPWNLIDGVNRAIREEISNSGDVLIDVSSLAETVGLESWHCPRQWNLAKLPFAEVFLPLYGDFVCRAIAALRGRSRRCLVVDLDNTLWSGVIGDDGLAGIRCAQGDPVGEAHLSFQSYLLALRDRGVVLAVSSKNEDATAREPFRKHPEMLLREEHFAVFQANWNDKATNIQAIAAELALGLDSFVFVDDNPFEREQVRRALPQVAVPELPDDPALYARTLSAAGYFEAVVFSEEDRLRAESYAGNARRAALREQAGNLDDYLASLNMEIWFRPFDEQGRARITQLINKSNQFNLTTHRYTEAEVARMEQDPNCFTLQVRLKDCLSDHGMISVVICRTASPQIWEISDWLMSCRVLGRGVEQVVLRELLKHAEEQNITSLVGSYRPTERNKLVEEHYQKLGFSLIEKLNDGSTVWKLDVKTASTAAVPMTVRSEVSSFAFGYRNT